jgi:hypothetical protein
MACEYFPDIYEHYPTGATKEDTAAVDQRNKDNAALYQAVRYLLVRRFGFKGTLPVEPKGLETTAEDATNGPFVPYLVSVYGLLVSEGCRDPRGGKLIPSSDDLRDTFDGHALFISRNFFDKTVAIVAEFQASEQIFTRVYGFLKDAGASSGSPVVNTIYARQVSEVSRRLVEAGADPNDAQLRLRALNLLSVVLGDDVDGRASTIDVSLPNLEDDADAVVLKDNVMAMSAVYFSAMLEDLKFYQVAHTVADQFMQGILPLSRGPGGESIYEFIKSAPNRLTEAERRTIYAQTLGLAQGSVEVSLPNREFADLWIRFLSSVSLNNRQNNIPNRVVTTGALVTPEQVFKAAKDLAVNLSLHGYGIGYFAAVELQKLARTVKSMLSFGDVISAYGVRDIWQLVERVSQLYLGGSVNGVRQRTMAQSGANIIQYLAANANLLSGALIPLDTSAINSDVERWLAVTGTDDNTVDKYSAPVSVAAQPTIPGMGTGQGMDMVRDALQRVGSLNPNIAANLPRV